MRAQSFIAEASTSAQSITKQAMVYQRLRSAILHCELEPGQRLIIEEIARQFHVSLIPVREALSLLQAERLVVTIPHVGATVAPLTRDAIREVFTVLEGLEVVATQAACEQFDAEQAQALEEQVALMDDACIQGDHNAWADYNTAWHRTIAHMTHMPLLQTMTGQALDRWDRIRCYFFRDVLIPRIEQAQQEHHAILQAMQARDTAALAHLLQEHNRQAMASYMAYLDRETSKHAQEEQRSPKKHTRSPRR